MTRHTLKISRRNLRGAGDIVHALAHPVAVVIDAVFGTNVKNCQGCQRRRAWMNEKFHS